DLLDGHVEAVLLEDAGFLGEREGREAGPARDADRDLGLLRVGKTGSERGGGKQDGVLLHAGSFGGGDERRVRGRRAAARRFQCTVAAAPAALRRSRPTGTSRRDPRSSS